MAWALLVLAGYVSGSIPFGYLIGRARGVDIRTRGSGNIGATNVGRVLGKKFGGLCFALDVLKGLAPTAGAGLAMGVWGTSSITASDASWWIGVAGATMAGHMFPVWLRFRGGKGVATGLGACLGIHPYLSLPALSALVVWIVSVRATRYVGFSSCVAAASLVVFVWVWHGLGLWGRLAGEAEGGGLAPFYAGTAVLAVIVVVKHRGNLARMARGEEPRLGEAKDG